jgi:hypothetical protein
MLNEIVIGFRLLVKLLSSSFTVLQFHMRERW